MSTTSDNGKGVSGKLRMSVLNVDDQLSSLKFRGWLRGELQDIQARAQENDYVFVRLFMTERLRLQITQHKLDQLLQSVVDRYPSIYRIETAFGSHMLTTEQMREESKAGAVELERMAREIDEWADDESAFDVLHNIDGEDAETEDGDTV